MEDTSKGSNITSIINTTIVPLPANITLPSNGSLAKSDTASTNVTLVLFDGFSDNITKAPKNTENATMSMTTPSLKATKETVFNVTDVNATEVTTPASFNKTDAVTPNKCETPPTKPTQPTVKPTKGKIN